MAPPSMMSRPEGPTFSTLLGRGAGNGYRSADVPVSVKPVVLQSKVPAHIGAITHIRAGRPGKGPGIQAPRRAAYPVVLGKHALEVPAAEDEHPVEALAPGGADHAHLAPRGGRRGPQPHRHRRPSRQCPRSTSRSLVPRRRPRSTRGRRSGGLMHVCSRQRRQRCKVPMRRRTRPTSEMSAGVVAEAHVGV